MKTLKKPLSILQAVAFLFLGNAAFAQNMTTLPTFAQTNQGNYQGQSGLSPQIIQTSLPTKSLGTRLLENTSLSYYQQFLGPTPSGSSSETYNVFQEGIDSPGSGRAPLQSFHAVNLRHQINNDWAIGTSLSAVNSYTDAVENKDKSGQTFTNKPDVEFFNARAYVSLPAVTTKIGTLFTSLSYEAPTSSTSKENEMRYGLVAAQSFAFKLPSVKWNAGVVGQIYRIYYKNNVLPPPFAPEFGGLPTPLQTTVVSGGPYVNYRFNDKWLMGSVITLDWDQRGEQTSTMQFNNNLPHRGRVNVTYFPQKIKFIQSVGLFSQALLKYSNQTTAFGADMSVKF